MSPTSFSSSKPGGYTASVDYLLITKRSFSATCDRNTALQASEKLAFIEASRVLVLVLVAVREVVVLVTRNTEFPVSDPTPSLSQIYEVLA